MKTMRELLNMMESGGKDGWKSLSVEDMYNYAVDNLSDDKLQKLDDELQGLHVEDKEDHEEALEIMVKFLSANL